MTRIEALKKLAEKVTGVRPKGRTIAQLIDAIAENYSGGGGGTVYFDATVDGATVTSDKTPQEVANLLKQGTNVICNIKMPDMYEDLEFPCTCLLGGFMVVVVGGSESGIDPLIAGNIFLDEGWSIRLA